MSWLNKLWNKEEDEQQYIDEKGSFSFSSMQKEDMKVLTLGKYDPNRLHMVVCDGLNLQGKCLNQSCDVFEQIVWVQLGYGSFDIGYSINNSVCPICKYDLDGDNIVSLGYRKSSIKAQGKVIGEEKKRWEPPKETQGKFHKFDGYDGPTSNWQYLRLTVEKA